LPRKSGTINGESGYKFMISAIDGAQSGGGGVDRYRIKIWDANTGKTLHTLSARASLVLPW